MTQRRLQNIEWLGGILTVLVGIAAWQASNPANDLYDIYPVFGLLAFGLMWTHFVFGAARRYFGYEGDRHSTYLMLSMAVVLPLILLHPVLLWIALYRDGLGLPPLSTYQAYSSEIVAISLGSIGLTIFLLYELSRLYRGRTWWVYIERLQIAGMVAIFIHALRLGGELQLSWYRGIWLFYGVTFFISVAYSWWHNRANNQEEISER